MPATTTSMVRSIWQNYFYAMDGQEKAAAAAAAAEEEGAKAVAEEVEDDPLEEDLQVGCGVGCGCCCCASGISGGRCRWYWGGRVV
jgi:class 3 adenylate cyclase